jgi:RNase adaptor protein for sRNA GlmZ degradation
MDRMGCDWCDANVPLIVGWLREEATKRSLLFLDAAGAMLVRRAIKNARRLHDGKA